MQCRLSGFVAATFTPMRQDGSLHLAMIRVIVRYRFHAGLKATMGLIGLDCAPNRFPTIPLNPQEWTERDL
jgi:hypothetical protein